MLKKLIFLFFYLLILSESLGAEDIIENNEIIVHFEEPLRDMAEEIVHIYPDIKKGLEERFGWRLNFRPVVRLINKEDFQEVVNNPFVVAIAVPKGDLILIDSSRANTNPFSLEITMKHELCHLMLYHYIKGQKLPKWLNEGVSQWASGGIAQIVMGSEGKKILREATLSRRFIPLKDLVSKFPQDKKALLLAYEESKSVVEYIISEFGTGGLLRILNNLRRGDETAEALQKALGISLEELERRWQDYLMKKTTWLTYLSDNLYTILFFLAGLITIYGFVRLMLKRRGYRDEEEDI
jgi:hypothetical protein